MQGSRLLCHPSDLRKDDFYVVAWDDASGPTLGIVGQLKSEVGSHGPHGDELVFDDFRTGETVWVGVPRLTICYPVDNPWNSPAEVEAQLYGS